MKLVIDYHFDAAHRLTFYNGGCFSLHGHRWNVRIEIEKFFSEEHMIVDFKEIKRIIDMWDHTTLLKDNAENEGIINALKKEECAIILLDVEPTAEELVMKLWEKISLLFPYKVSINVKLWESPGAMIEYNGE